MTKAQLLFKTPEALLNIEIMTSCETDQHNSLLHVLAGDVCVFAQ